MTDKIIELRNVASVISGYAFKSQDLGQKGTPIVKIKNIRDGYVDLTECQKFDENLKPVDKKFVVQNGDILITLTGSHLSQPNSMVGRVGRYNLPTPALLNQRAGKVIVTDESLTCPDFLFYYLSQKKVKAKLAKNASGSANQANISPSQVESLNLPSIGINAQKAISSSLKNYDDLIENNRRRIALLEESARLLFRNISGKTANRKNQIPLSEVSILISRGITPKYDDEGNSLVINQKCIRDHKVSLGKARRQSKTIPEHKLLRKFDVVVNSTGTGTLGRVAQNLHDSEFLTADSHVTICRPKGGFPPLWYGMAVKEKQSIIETLGRGSTNQTELSRDDLGRVRINMPLPDAKFEYDELAEPIFKQISILSKHILRLTEARDLLLPRLMDGRITL